MSRPAVERITVRLTKIGGRRKWYGRWTEPGQRRTKVQSLGTESENEAEIARAALEEDLNNPGEQVTVATVLDARWEDLKARGRGHQNYKLLHDQVKERLGTRRVADLTQRVISDYHKKRAPLLTSCRHELEELRSALLLAVKHKWIDEAPAIHMPPKRPPRDKFLTKVQARRLIEAARAEHIRLFIMIALTTGARRGAIQGLTWDRVDLDRGFIDFNDPEKAITKKRRAAVPIDRRLCAALREAQKDARTPFVLEYRGKPITKNINRGFTLAAERAGLPWCTPHVLKHTAISWLAEKGFTVDQIADMTATDANTVRRIYRKFNPDYLADLSTALADEIFEQPKEANAV